MLKVERIKPNDITKSDMFWIEVTAPLYWWLELENYSFPFIREIERPIKKEFTLEDFSCEDLTDFNKNYLIELIDNLNALQEIYYNFDSLRDVLDDDLKDKNHVKMQMKQLMPSSYNYTKEIKMMRWQIRQFIERWDDDLLEANSLDEWREFIKVLRTFNEE